MSAVFAIDPGPVQSGWAIWTGAKVRDCGVMGNADLLRTIEARFAGQGETLAIEMIASYGMAVGREVFETCVWVGRFQQAWHSPASVRMVYRKEVKSFLCGSMKAKDANIRQALIDLVGGKGTKAAPGPTYGVKSHAWPALAVAVTAAHQMGVADKLQAAIEQARRLDRPLSEIRLHPDDLDALRAECAPMLQADAAHDTPDQFGGLPIVEDELADRMSRAHSGWDAA